MVKGTLNILYYKGCRGTTDLLQNKNALLINHAQILYISSMLELQRSHKFVVCR